MANYDTTKLTNLGHLKMLAEAIKEQYAKAQDVSTLQSTVSSLSTDVDVLEEKVGTLEAASGQQNIIEKIQVNGEDQSIGEGKTVNIKVPVNVSDLENDEGFQKASEVEAIAKSEIDKFAKQVTENETIDTFAEVLQYIGDHGDVVAGIIQDIESNDSAIEALKKLVGEKAVNTQIAEALIDYVQNETLENYVTNNQLNDTLEGYVQDSTLEETLGEYVENETLNTTLSEYVKKEGNKVLSDVNFSNNDKQKLDSFEIADDEEVQAVITEFTSTDIEN